MAGDRSNPAVRVAQPEEFAELRVVELAADQLFESVGIGPFTSDIGGEHLDEADLVLVTGRPPVGFVSVQVVDGLPHVRQLSVHPDHARRGLGRTLMEAAADWARTEGFAAMTLTTFRDVPWNGPFYASLGFVVVDDPSPGVRAIRAHERAIGEDDFGPRVAMKHPLC